MVWVSEASFGLTLFVQISLIMWNNTLISKTFPSLTKLLVLVPHYTSSLQQMWPTLHPCHLYHLSSAEIWLSSSQAYHQLDDGSSELIGNRVMMHLKQQLDMSIRNDIRIPIDHHDSITYNCWHSICLDLTSSAMAFFKYISVFLIIWMLRLMNLNVSLIVTPRCVDPVLDF